jgi:hypothetical protein
MADKPPPRLYKYQPFSTRALTALKSRTLWFARPSTLNDPYDCAVPYRLAEVTLEECCRLLRTKKDGGWPQLRSDRRYVDEAGTPTEEFRQLVERAGDEGFAQFAQDNYTKRGISCFSESPTDTLLSSHYGGGHRGFCLEFDTSSQWLAPIHQVRYARDLPEINLVDILCGDHTRTLSTLLTKAECWSYEREWRAIHSRPDQLYGYGVEALTGVYLGAALEPPEKDLIGHILHGSPTNLYEVDRSASSFRLEARQVQYSRVGRPDT